MRLGVLVGVAMLTIFSGGIAGAETGQRPGFMEGMDKTVYATNQHMTFSMRATLIRWLGGVPVSREKDLRASEREAWWGEKVPLVPAETAREHGR